jgi:hypothetical protein
MEFLRVSLPDTHKFTADDLDLVARSLSSLESTREVSFQLETTDSRYTLIVHYARSGGPFRQLRYSFDDLGQNLVPIFNTMSSRAAFFEWLSRRIAAAIALETSVAPTTTPLDVQVGGNHYKDLAIQPVQYIHQNQLGYLEGNVVKYVTRHATKNGVQDLLKARHYIDLLLELEYGHLPQAPDAAQRGPAQPLPGQPPRGADAE